MAVKTEKLAGIYCLSCVYEVDLRGIISMSVPKGIADRENENLRRR
jgi:hypothetical protein